MPAKPCSLGQGEDRVGKLGWGPAQEREGRTRRPVCTAPQCLTQDQAHGRHFRVFL